MKFDVWYSSNNMAGCGTGVVGEDISAPRIFFDHHSTPPRKRLIGRVFMRFQVFEAALLRLHRHSHSRPYWRRLWVVQELLLNKKVHFLCGQKRFSWKNIGTLMIDVEEEMAIAEFQDKSPKQFSKSPKTHFLYFPRKLFLGASGFKQSRTYALWAALTIFTDFKCAEPRDQVTKCTACRAWFTPTNELLLIILNLRKRFSTTSC